MTWGHEAQVRLREIALDENSVWVDYTARRMAWMINEVRFSAWDADRFRTTLWLQLAGWENEGALGAELKALADQLAETVE